MSDFEWPRELQTTIDGLAQGGDGVGRYAGRPVFVAAALPGEQVRVRLTERRNGWARGVLLEAPSNPAAERVTPPCPVYQRCGGCDWQHQTIESQRQAKQTILAEQLRFVAQTDQAEVAATAAAEPWHYRSVARVHIDGRQVGFYAAGGRQIVEFDQCLIIDPRLNAAIERLKPLLPLVGLREVSLRLSTTDGTIHGHLLGQGQSGWRSWARRWLAADKTIAGVSAETREGWMALAGAEYLYEQLGNVRLRITPTSFFQANVERARAVLQQIEQFLPLNNTTRLLDGFCGVGTFLLPLAHKIGHGWGIEEHPAAIRDAQASAKANQLNNLTLKTGKVEAILPQLKQQFDLAIVDPPRRGVEPVALNALIAAEPTMIAYVSCHPGTLARDIKILQAGGYSIQHAQPYDFFPQTSHVESLVLLSKV
ncbi:23S rRNA (uracil(1939)-C(5))-methyltransferase RlmD [Herpetosiphon giganteus]|uniref:23S rRNA (uracil(1939)-C(5))-methyltransferase RlmD n=1 Tax=Herpetosiphon giganteus TaxID=2029754 RepID=UPI00195A65C2|nr:23S rRNA (uracil(1939)-C(5))-methyltransferase RlmD [Herpetosiphon giganteus]MBM7845834.1 23S rRNA (uracil1939-C5)-methyltransferase [Herpetosiphon giganteus]